MHECASNLKLNKMEKWDSYYHHEDFETEIYAGASHVRYPVIHATGPLSDHSSPETGSNSATVSTFTSATARGAKSWSTSRVDSELELSPPESPISIAMMIHRYGLSGLTVCVK